MHALHKCMFAPDCTDHRSAGVYSQITAGSNLPIKVSLASNFAACLEGVHSWGSVMVGQRLEDQKKQKQGFFWRWIARLNVDVLEKIWMGE